MGPLRYSSPRVRRAGIALLAVALAALLAYVARSANAQTPTPTPTPTPTATPTPTPSPPPPINWQVQSGAGVGTTAIEAFLPSTIKVRAGDSITWAVASDESHTVTFLPAGAQRPPELIPGPEPGTLQDNPATFLPSDPPGTIPDVTGARLVGSGLMTKGQKFTARFPQAGTFSYICAIHPFMTGTVTVVQPDQAVPSQAEVDAAGKAELAKLEAVVEPARQAALARVTKEDRPDGTALWTITTGTSADPDPQAPGNVDLLAYFPADITIREGDTIRWQWGHLVPHTVTFMPAGEAPPPLIIPQPQPAGAPILLVNPKALAPSVPAGGRYDGTGFVNSGLLGPPPPDWAPPAPPPLASFELTFTRAGTYSYLCLVHLELGQRGTVTVQARPAAPAVLPRTGNGGPAQGGGLPWLWLALGGAGALLALAALAWQQRAWARR